MNAFDPVERLLQKYAAFLSWRDSGSGEVHYATISIGDDWIPAIDSMLQMVEAATVHNPDNAPIIRDIKDKRGHLCILYDGGNERVDDIIERTENYLY